MALAIPNTLGTRPHAFKLDDPLFFDREFETEFGHVLKGGVEKCIEKLEIMSAVTSKNKKFKLKAEKHLEKLDSTVATHVSKAALGTELEKIESRIQGFITE